MYVVKAKNNKKKGLWHHWCRTSIFIPLRRPCCLFPLLTGVPEGKLHSYTFKHVCVHICSAGQPRWSIWENPKGTRSCFFSTVCSPGCVTISEIVFDQQILSQVKRVKHSDAMVQIICVNAQRQTCPLHSQTAPASMERLVITMATRAKRRTCISRRSSDVMQLSVSPSRGAIVPAAAAPQVVTAKKKSVHFKAIPPSSTWETRSISLQPPG